VFFDTGVPLEVFHKRMEAQNILVGRLFPPFSSWCRITIGTEPDVDASRRPTAGRTRLSRLAYAPTSTLRQVSAASALWQLRHRACAFDAPAAQRRRVRG
jgi:hypothetical protein